MEIEAKEEPTLWQHSPLYFLLLAEGLQLVHRIAWSFLMPPKRCGVAASVGGCPTLRSES
jgi:hypothetical protein